MPSFRKPWPISRTRTDDVTLNTLGSDGKTADYRITEVAPDNGESSSGSRGADSPGERAEDDLKQFRTLHKWDPNLERESTCHVRSQSSLTIAQTRSGMQSTRPSTSTTITSKRPSMAKCTRPRRTQRLPALYAILTTLTCQPTRSGHGFLDYFSQQSVLD